MGHGLGNMVATKEGTKPRYDGWKVTREEYLSLPDDGFRYDMIQGELQLSPSGFFEHGFSQSHFITILGTYLKKTKSALLVSEIDVFFPDGEDVVRPDVICILNSNKGIIKGHIHGVPDLVCEVLSPSTRLRDLGEKADRYLKNGVKEYWILDPEQNQIQAWWNENKTSWSKRTALELESQLFPGLVVNIEEVFGGLKF